MATETITRESTMVMQQTRGMARLKQTPPSFPVTLLWGMYLVSMAMAYFTRIESPELLYIRETWGIPPIFVVFVYFMSSVTLTGIYWLFRNLTAVMPGSAIMLFMAGAVTLYIGVTKESSFSVLVDKWFIIISFFVMLWLAEWVEALQAELSLLRAKCKDMVETHE